MTGGILVPIADTPTVEQTVQAAVETREETTQPLHLVRVMPGKYAEGIPDREAELLERAEQTARKAGCETVETAVLGIGEYVSGPDAHCVFLEEYAAANDVDRLVLDPQYAVDATDPTLQSIESSLSGRLDFEYAELNSGSRVTRNELHRAGIIGVLAFGFYIALGGPTSAFTLASGLVTGVIAAALLRNVAFETTPRVGRSLGIAARLVLFFPYLLWEITKANVLFAYIVLHPSMPIDPRLDRVDVAVGTGPSVTALANTITLTPGTLTLDASGRQLLVHSMTQDAQDDVLDGLHEKAVRFLFYGRAASELPGPRERGDYERYTNDTTESMMAADRPETEGSEPESASNGSTEPNDPTESTESAGATEHPTEGQTDD